MTTLYCGRYRLVLDRPLIMGIVNLTPDSFSGDGVGDDTSAAIAHAEAQRAAGADILDLGAESSRPGAAPVPAEVEITRLRPVLRALRDWDVPVSVDTAKPEVMRMAIDEGAALINDIMALRAPGALECVANSDVGVCLMHMQKDPRTMQAQPHYEDVVEEVHAFLTARLMACVAAGIEHERICIDPGFGFGKTVAHNYTLLRELRRFTELGVPVLAGLSRKSMLGAVTGRDSGPARMPASIAAALLAVERGARIVRVHDVRDTVQALRVREAMRSQSTDIKNDSIH